MRTLASIQQIKKFVPIPDRDMIVLATFVDLGWQAIVRKDDFKEGDLCVFIEPDSLLPSDDPSFAFMASRHFKVKTMKMAGVLSQGLVMPISILPDGMKPHRGMDVTELLKITEFGVDDASIITSTCANISKYPRWLMHFAWFRKLVLPKKQQSVFPSEFPRTDETRIQSNPRFAEMYNPLIATEKVDEQSTTYMVKRIRRKFFKDKFEFIVCSHNRRLFDKTDMPQMWKNADKYNIAEELQILLETQFPCDDWIAIQGETIAPSVQGNNYKLASGETDLYVFNVITQKNGRLSPELAMRAVRMMEMQFVPIIDTNVDLSGKSVNEILDYATGASLINPNRMREGIVFRSMTDSNKSFKAVSPSYLLKEGK